MGEALDSQVELLMGRASCCVPGRDIGPDMLLVSGLHRIEDGEVAPTSTEAVDLCLSGPEDVASGPSSPREISPGVLEDFQVRDEEFVAPAEELSGHAGVDDGSTVSPTIVAPSMSQPVPVDEFVNAFKKPLQQPVIATPPRPRATRNAGARATPDKELVPMRSARLAAKSKYRERKPEAQAKKSDDEANRRRHRDGIT